MDFLLNNLGLITGASASGVVLYALKKVPNKDISANVERACYKLGKLITLGMTSKKSPIKKFWNKTIEPWFIDFLDNIVGGAIRGLIRGLRID